MFLLTGVSGLLNVFNARLTRIAGRADCTAELLRNSRCASRKTAILYGSVLHAMSTPA